MAQPKIQARKRVVVVRIPQIQETQHLLIDEIEPKKTVIHARAAFKCPRPQWRIANGGKDVPGRRDREQDNQAADRPQALPGPPQEELPRRDKVRNAAADGNRDGDHAFYEQAHPKARRQEKGPEARILLIIVEGALK